MWLSTIYHNHRCIKHSHMADSIGTSTNTPEELSGVIVQLQQVQKALAQKDRQIRELQNLRLFDDQWKSNGRAMEEHSMYNT